MELIDGSKGFLDSAVNITNRYVIYLYKDIICLYKDIVYLYKDILHLYKDIIYLYKDIIYLYKDIIMYNCQQSANNLNNKFCSQLHKYKQNSHSSL